MLLKNAQDIVLLIHKLRIFVAALITSFPVACYSGHGAASTDTHNAQNYRPPARTDMYNALYTYTYALHAIIYVAFLGP